MNVNSLALYRGRPALVTDIGEKITIIAGTGKGSETIKVRAKDIEVLHPGPLGSLLELEAPAAPASVPDAGQNAPDTAWDPGADIRGAWELIESGGSPVSLRELAELAFGAFSPQSAWAAWHLVAEGLYFTGTPAAVSARTGAELDAALEKRRDRMRETRDREAFLGRLRSRRTEEGDGRFLQDVEALAYGQSAKSRTMKDLGLGETPQEAHRLLLECGFWDRGVNPHPRRFGLSLGTADTFPPEAAKQFAASGTGAETPAEATAAEAAETGLRRRDLTALPAFAIDSAWSDDPDDAVSLEHAGGRPVLYVHVADPASLVSSGSPADLEARRRGATLYLPEGIWRMLPEEALPRFALGLSERSPALTFRITLDGRGAVEDTEIFPSIVKVRRLSYEEADALLEPETALSTAALSPADREAARILQDLCVLGEANLERRLNAGGVHIALPEVHISAEHGKVDIRPIVPGRSAGMVRECMLLAGEGTAAWAARRRIPFPYILQETGDLPARPLPGLAGSYQLRRCMRPRSVSARPGAHWGLGLDGYCQVTSPLRRYTDLLAHQQIRAHLAGGGGFDEEELLVALAAGDAAAGNVTQAERASRAHWTAVYLESLSGRPGANPVWEAVALDRRGNGAGILIP
ncbi:MAG: RNB domain-containing ribonuclease, partial [Treponema sp.]|nr:RNB domain-containing ribonuclease [Treponema sp.]